MNKTVKNSARTVARIALMSASLVAGKFALSFVPNVEVVTALIIVYGVVFGYESVFATLVFCTLDIFIYPPSLDVIISYYLYFDLLAIISATMSNLGVLNKYAYLALGVLMTALFGVITSAFYSLLFGTPFFAVYLSGLLFYAVHIISTLVFMLVGFTPLKNVLTKIKNKNFNVT